MDTQKQPAPALDRLDAAVQIIEMFMQKHRALAEAREDHSPFQENAADEGDVHDTWRRVEFAAAQYVTAREELAALILTRGVVQ